jgi:uncharacterized protein YqjF (DUF2071 family)
MRDPRPFLATRWESLVFLNFECPRSLLDPLVPAGTTLDPWNGTPLVSLVGLMFRDTRVRGIPVPRHRTFEEVNLRFYVRRPSAEGGARRGVVFIRELVPRSLIAAVAWALYNEPYLALRMGHRITLDPASGGGAEYFWWRDGVRSSVSASAAGPATRSSPGSEAEFITEHYWGYTRQRDGTTLEYRVEHPRWRVWPARSASYETRSSRSFGVEFGEVLAKPPGSAYIAVGSPVSVFPGRRLVAEEGP